MKLVFFLLLGITLANNKGLSDNDIIQESQACGEHKFNQEDCVATFNCLFIEWHINQLATTIPFCFSYNEVMRYFIKIPDEYLKKNRIKNYKTINKSNFCDIISSNEKFLEIDGKISTCKINLEL